MDRPVCSGCSLLSKIGHFMLPMSLIGKFEEMTIVRFTVAQLRVEKHHSLGIARSQPVALSLKNTP